MGKRLTIEIKKKIFQCFQQGMRTRSVARQLNLRCSTVEQLETKYCGGDISWINSSYTKVDPEKLSKAVLEYLNSPDGYFRLAKKYGLSSSCILMGVKNYQKHGIVHLPRGRNAMQRFQEQQKKLKTVQNELDEDTKPLSKKEQREIRDLLEVNIALLEVLEECNLSKLKKKN